MSARMPILALGAAGALVAGVVAGQMIYNSKQDQTINQTNNPVETWDKLASKYDKLVNFDEWMTGVTSRRSDLLRRAHGRTLELAVGTARNLEAYPSTVSEIVAIDRSPEMIEEARKKAKASAKDGKLKAPIKFAVIDADSEQISKLPSHSFDTIAATFDLCSYNKPEQVMQEMTRLLRVNDPSALNSARPVILLLEHGLTAKKGSNSLSRTMHSWLDSYLHSRSAGHFARFGCEWDRDIEGMIEHAARELGWKVIERQTFHLGTGQMFVIHVDHKKTHQSADTSVS